MVEKTVRSIVGADGCFEVRANGLVEVSPRSDEECALVLAAANERGWQVRFQGGGGWIDADGPADLTINTNALVGVTDFSPADMVLTAGAGTTIDELQTAAADEGTWSPLDPPGTNRTLGSVLATGTAGPLRSGYGPVRARILGLTFVTADGRIVRVGGRVVKNVAGFDLSSLAVGSFGAFGLITSAHVRLCAVPALDVTLIAYATRKVLLDCARAILASGLTPAALELVSQDTSNPEAWALVCRLMGSESAVEIDRKKVVQAVPQLRLSALECDDARTWWSEASGNVTGFSSTVRLGSLPSDLVRVLDLLSEELHDGKVAQVSASILPGVIRWSGDASTAQLKSLRQRAARHEWPVTLERAPWETRTALGHYGAYPDGVGPLVHNLRAVFDSRGILCAPLGDAE